MGNPDPYEFDLFNWLPRFPLQADYERYEAKIITSPRHACINEQLRREVADQLDWGRPVPVDIFVMADGEPAHRWVTKVGGLPYRPAAKPWPEDPDGQRLTFIAQFCFAASKDLSGDLPGDVLLAFGGPSGDDLSELVLEWHPLGLTDLVSPKQLPVQHWRIHACYGVRFRTAGYLEAKRKEGFGDSKYLTCRGIEVSSEYLLPQYQAMQIGRAPFYVQGDPHLPGMPLCVICSVCPDPHGPYPWVNRPEPLYSEEDWGRIWTDNHGFLQIGDAGCIYISIDDNYQLHFSEQYY